MIYGGDLMSNFAGSIKHGDTEMTRGVVLSKISKLIEKEPSLLIKALKDSGVKVSEKATKIELIDKSVEGLHNSEKFRTELAKSLVSGSPKFSNAVGDGSGVSTPNVTVGADPISAIAGAIGSIFSFGSSIKQGKDQKEADKRALQMQLLQGDTKKTNWLPVVIISGVLLIGGVVAYVSLRKK